MPKNPTPRRRAKLQHVLELRQPDLTLVLANIHDPHNVSAIYRSCDAFGVERVHLYYTDTAFPILGRKSSASARKWVGNEHRGVDPELLSIADGSLYIPMFGMIQSFNVSVAAALILSEASRQREIAGMYASPRYAPEELERRLEDWIER